LERTPEKISNVWKIAWLLLLGMMWPGSAGADLLLGFDVSGLAGNQVTTTNSVAAANISVASPNARITRGAGLTGTSAGNSMASSGWTLPGGATAANAVTSNDYHRVILMPDSGYLVTVTNISVRLMRSSTGPTNFTLRSSVDDFASDLTTWTNRGNNTASNYISTITGISDSTGVEFRVYGYKSTAISGTGRVPTDGAGFGSAGVDFAIFGTVASAVSEPTVTTSAGTATNTTTATVGGNVTDDGGATVTNRGVVYNTSSGVTISDNKTQSGSGTGSFTTNLSSLSVNTRYYFKAYAQNSVGTTLGSELEFWTWANVPSAPTVNNPTTSSLDVNVNPNSNPSTTLFSIQATNSSLFVQTNGTLGATEHWRTDSEWGTIAVTGLSPSQQYGFQVRARNGHDTVTAFSSVGNGTTSAGATVPTVTTTVANPTNETSATSGGNVTADGGATVTNRGVVWATAAAPTVPGNQSTNGTGTGSYSATLTNLISGATYYYRAFAQNSAGTGYGTEYNLTTPCFNGVVTGLAVSVTNQLDFTAVWSNFAGATGYQIDVSTTSSFAGGSANYGHEAFTNVDGGTVSSYLTRQWTNNGVAWTGYQARIDQTINSTEAITFQNSGGSFLISQPITGGVNAISFKHQRKFGSGGDSGSVDVFVNSTKVATNVTYGDNVVTTLISGINVSGTFTLSITNATSSHRVAIDDLIWTNDAAASFVPGYASREVAATSVSVTGLTGGVTYYFRVRATNEFCTSQNSATNSVTTPMGSDVTAPVLINFNAMTGMISDAQIDVGFSITGQVYDAGGISNSTVTPSVSLLNPSGTVLIASNKFDIAPANGSTVTGTLFETFSGALYNDVLLGAYTAQVSAVDVTGNSTVSNFVFTVFDDDTVTPTINSADITYGGVGSRYFAVTTNSTPAIITNRAGSFADVRYTLTDAELAEANARDLRFAFGGRDATSGIARGAAGTTNTVMNFSVENIISGNFTNYRADLSGANYTNARTTNVWSFPSGFFTESFIVSLMSASSNRVSVTIPDDDNDRTNDYSVLVSETVGWISAADDDPDSPVISGLRVNLVGNSEDSTIFISQYYEGTSNNKWIELYNAGSASVDLGADGYRLGFWANSDRETWKTGASPSVNLSVTGVVAAGATYVLGENSATLPAYAVKNQVFVGGFNGDDTVVLYMGASYSTNGIVDSIGLTGNDLEDTSIVRSNTINQGNSALTDYNPAEWSEVTLATVAAAATNVPERIGYHYAPTLIISETITDGELVSGVSITGLVQDSYSGVYGTNTFGSLAPTISVYHANGSIVYGARFMIGPTNAGALTPASFSNNFTLASGDITIGATYTSRVVVWDYDNDRSSDSSVATQSLAFLVIDDDTNAPSLSGFQLIGGNTNLDLSIGSMVITGIIDDASSPNFPGSYYLLRDSSGSIVISNRLYGNSTTNAWAAHTNSSISMLNCGQAYTVTVFAFDADLDRGAVDSLGSTGGVFVIRTFGAGGPADYPVASNLLVNGTAAAPSTILTDAEIRTGGWDLAINMSHSVGVVTNNTSPSFKVTNSTGVVIANTPWSNAAVSGVTIYFTNNSLPGASQAAISLGTYYVVWSASNQGSCVASIVDRSVISSGTNIFTVVDDDEAAPVAGSFAVSGYGATIDVAVASSGFSITGLVQDSVSGVAFTSQPPYFLFYDIGGSVLASNTFSGHSEGAGLATGVALTNWFSGLSLSCGNAYTVRIFAADADADRISDRTSVASNVLVVYTSGSGGEAPAASDLRITNTVASSVVLTDEMISTGGWSMAMTISHSSGALVTNGGSQPSFLVQNPSGTHAYASSPLTWNSIVKSGIQYFATNPVMPSAVYASVMTGTYRLVWSAQSEGLCFGSTNASGFISPGTNRFTVVDDDTVAPNMYSLNVGGGTGSGCGGGNSCPDPTRTNLIAGDIALFAMNTLTKGSGSGATNNDAFAFVTLVDIPSGTQIKITDNGWKSSTASFRNNEGTITWRATNCVPAGTVVRWIATNTPVFNVGQLAANSGSFAPNIQGEQLLAYQGSDSSPSFIHAINDRLNGIWDVDAVDSHSSAIPPGLVDGYTAVAVGEFDNIILNTNNLLIAGGRDDVLYYIGDQGNWIGSDESVYDLLIFNFTFPDLCTASGTITDHDIYHGGWSITGMVQDITSGLSVSNDTGLRYVIMNTSNEVVVSNYFATTFANGSKLLHAVSNGVVGGDYDYIQLGMYTSMLHATDIDNDRPLDVSGRVTNVPFTVVDDDTDPPQIGYFFINGQTTITNPAELASVIISGQVRDVTSGIAFEFSVGPPPPGYVPPPGYSVYDSAGGVVQSGYFDNMPTNNGEAVDWEPIWTSPIDLSALGGCGTYTVRVDLADADNDRIDDRRSVTQSFLIALADGSGVEPEATNLLVNTMPPSIAVLTDGEINSGGWSLAVKMQHPSGILVDNPFTPEFIIQNPSASNVISQVWTGIVTSGNAIYATNSSLPSVTMANVQTGYYSLYWSARSQGACFGEVTDSYMISGDTNRFQVVDDDTSPPPVMTNVLLNAMTWTNNPAFVITWSTNHIVDASGIGSFRLSTNQPVGLTSGTNIAITNQVVLTNLVEGVTTNWLFVVDADQDRTNDALMSAVTNVVMHLDMTAPDQVTDLALALGPDDTAEIAVNWTAVPDAGNPELSPWRSYHVYYTEGTSAPTVSDSYFSSTDGLSTLATNDTDSTVLSNFTFDTTYTISIAGVDRAGNIGPLSEPETITMGLFSVTQGVVLVKEETALYWTATSNKVYDIIYVDAHSFDNSLSNQWGLMHTVTNSWLLDTGSVTRSRPYDLINTMRFYRAAREGAWKTNMSPRLGSREVYAAKTTKLYPGENWMSLSSIPDSNTVVEVFGRNKLPGGDMFADGTKISWYSPVADANNPYGVVTAQIWLASSSSNWLYQVGGSGLANHMIVPEHQGFNIELPLDKLELQILLIGQVPTGSVVTVVAGGTRATNSHHVLSYSVPVCTAITNLGFRGSGLVGNNNGSLADEIRILQPGGNGSLSQPKARLRLRTDGVTWQYYDYNATSFPNGVPSPDQYVIEPDEAIIVIRRNQGVMNWTNRLTYTPPNKNFVP